MGTLAIKQRAAITHLLSLYSFLAGIVSKSIRTRRLKPVNPPTGNRAHDVYACFSPQDGLGSAASPNLSGRHAAQLKRARPPRF
jgi:hypothetical protein